MSATCMPNISSGSVANMGFISYSEGIIDLHHILCYLYKCHGMIDCGPMG